MSLPRPAVVLLAGLGVTLASPGASGAYTVSADFNGVVTEGYTTETTFDYETGETRSVFLDLVGRTAYLSVAVEVGPEGWDGDFWYPASFAIAIEGAYGFTSDEAWGQVRNAAPGLGPDSIEAGGVMYVGRYGTPVSGYVSLSDPTGSFFDALGRQTASGAWEGRLEIRFGGSSFWFDSLGYGGYSEYRGQQFASAPEPGTLGLVASGGLCGLWAVARRRRRRA